MPSLTTFDQLILDIAREAFAGQFPADLQTTGNGVSGGTSLVFADLAYGTSGSTTTAFHDTFMYLRRFSGLATAGGASTITLRTSMGTLATDVLKNMTLKITAGTSSGDTRTISSNTNAGPTVATVASAFTATPDTTSFYEIYPSHASEDRITRATKALSTGSFTESSGTITVAPKFAGDAGASMLMGIGSDMLFFHDFHPSEIKKAVNRLIRNLVYESYLPITLIPDGDMEGSYTLGSTASFTEWSLTGTPTSAAKSTTNYPFQFGRQYLNVVTGTNNNAGVQSATIAVDPDENLTVGVLVQKVPTATETGNFDVVLRDITNGTDLKVVTVTGQQPVLVYFQESGASTTEEVAIQVISAAASAASSFRVGPVFVTSDRRNRYSVDTSVIERQTDIAEVFYLPLGNTLEDDVYFPNEPLESLVVDTEQDDVGNVMNIVVPHLIPPRPMFMKVYQRFPELSIDTDQTRADREMIVQGVMSYIERLRERRTPVTDRAIRAEHRRKAQEYANNYWSIRNEQNLFVKAVSHSERRQLIPMS